MSARLPLNQAVEGDERIRTAASAVTPVRASGSRLGGGRSAEPYAPTLDAILADLERPEWEGQQGREVAVYFARDGDAVKIGITDGDPAERVRGLQVGNSRKITLLGFCEGVAGIEWLLHAHFAQLRIRGEWFQLTPELQSVIDELLRRQDERDQQITDEVTRREWLELREEGVL